MMHSRAQAAGSRWLDPVMWMVAPAVIFMLAVFVYPFLHGLMLSFEPLEGGTWSNYIKFFNTEHVPPSRDRKSTRLNSSHVRISYAVFCLKKKTRLAVPSARRP